MKRVFPLIVILITLSVLGILFIQMQWISNAILVKKDQFEQDKTKSMLAIHQGVNDAVIHEHTLETMQYPVGEEAKHKFLAENFSVQKLSKEEVNDIIKKALLANGIKQPFDFCITNIFLNPVLQSDGWDIKSFPDAISEKLSDNSYLQQETLYLNIREPKNYIISRMGWMIVASIILTAVIISAFTLTVRTLFAQKKLSEIKSDFINNMTHELKTPLATISLAVDALVNKKVIEDQEKIRFYSGMIREENKRMNKQVEIILQAARIERQEITLKLEPLNAHEIIGKIAGNLILQIEERNGQLDLHLNAKNPIIYADDLHFSNIIFNLLDNAIKYSESRLQIDIETINLNNYLSIKVSDMGIGMNKETQLRVFEKFYRAHTGNLHNVKGFGLGLSYVKAMVDEQGGRIKVESTPGKGSTFTVTFPLYRETKVQG